MAESLAYAFLKPVLEQLSSSIVTEFSSLWGLQKDMDKLSDVLSSIQSVLQDAEEKQIHSHQVRNWMRKLKDAAYNAEDILTKFEDEALQSKGEDGSQTSKWKQAWDFCLSGFGLKPLLLRYEITHKIKKINERLDEITKEQNDLHLLREQDGGSRILEIKKRPETESLIHETAAFCRENDKKNLIDQLVSDDDCWLLLRKRAFPNGDWDEHRDLVVIGHEIAKKCKGLPLAAKTLGGLLQGTREETKWKEILDSKIWEQSQGGKDTILAPLRLSFHHLPSDLKQCFMYCSIFPKGHEFEKEKLVNLWLAEGFITSEVGQREIEDVSYEYFDDLIWRSFLYYECNVNWRWKYKMHDLIYDLAQSVSKDECFFPKKAMYLSCITHEEIDPEIFKKVLTRKRLRTLFGDSIERVPSLNSLFQRLICLRVLDLKLGRGIKELPDSIGNLKQLRYLAISSENLERLPESMCNLFNLQTLDVWWCLRFVELPKNIQNLINLRHLLVFNPTVLKGIGALTCLRTLSDFAVGKETGRDIGQLMRLINLRGRLRISRLENVVNAEEDVLKNKQFIEKLELSWSSEIDRSDNDGSDNDGHDASVDEEILKRLQPHPANLKNLRIEDYEGERFPRWIGNPSFSKLANVALWYCESCQTFPPLWQLPFLKVLKIYGMAKVSRVFCADGIMITKPAFPSLEKLVMESLPDLVEWGGGDEEGDFPCLRKLHIKTCKSLIAIPRFLTSLHEFRMDKCNGRILSSLSHCTALSFLEIDRCENLKVIPSGSFMNLKALKELSIRRWEELVSLVEDDVEDCKHLHSLESLQIFDCPQLMVLPEGLKNLISLKHLSISSCERLTTLPEDGLPTTLQSLSISSCPLLPKWSLIAEKEGDFPCLHELQIRNCKSLIALPRFLTSLLELSLGGCNERILSSVSYFTSLSSLRIDHNENLKAIPSGLFSNLKALKRLSISDCKELVSLVEDDDCRDLHSLESLEIKNCPKLKVLPDGLKNLLSLKRLSIHYCKRLAALPKEGLPPILQSFEFWGCPLLKKRCKDECSEDWPKISQIPNILIHDPRAPGVIDDTSSEDDELRFMDDTPSEDEELISFDAGLNNVLPWNCAENH